MKKIFIAMLMAVAATASFAQNPKIDKDIKATKDFNAGLELFKSQEATLTNEEKAKAYNELYKLIKPAFDKNIEAAQSGGTVDNKVIMNTIQMATKCEEFGWKDAAKYMSEVSGARGTMINAANGTTDNNEKLQYSLTYINSAKDGDGNIGYAYFFAGYAYYLQKDYKSAAKYAKSALADDRVKEMAEQVYVSSIGINMETKQDTLAYIGAMKEANPTKYFQQIVSYLNAIGETAEAEKMVNEELAANPNNKSAYYVRGQKSMQAQEYDKAIEDLKKAVEIDPEYLQAWYFLGVCESQKGFDLNDKYTDKNGMIPTDKKAEVSNILKEAIKYYEKVRELDPDHEKITNWPMQLRMLYNNVGESEKANEISKMLGDN